MALFGFRQELDPMNALLRLQSELDSVFQRPRGWEPGVSGRGVHPPINVFRDAEGYVIKLEVPGYGPDDLSLESREQTLYIGGKRSATEEPANGSYHRRERETSEFKRSMQVPRDLDPSRSEASCRNGVLTIRVPLREEAKARRIDVKTS
jgi:HSP20 family protein